MRLSGRLQHLVKYLIAYPDVSVPTVSTKHYLTRRIQDPRQAVTEYIRSLFPITHWIHRYNLSWLTRDVIAGLTVGIVVVPQGMSYALLANLPVEYGLYTSFVGVLIYCFFATSKDVTIGPVAVMSLTVGEIINQVNLTHPNRWSNTQIATTLGFICGFITFAIGMLRIGWVVEFIPAPAVSGFMTGSAISIVAGQLPSLLGLSGFDTRAPPFNVIMNTLKHLLGSKLDAVWGLTGLVTLYGIRWICDRLGKRYPRRARLFFYLSILRIAFTITTLTLASYLYCKPRRTHTGNYPIQILQDVSRGLRHVEAPVIDPELVGVLKGRVPVATVILLLEHIAIAKSFGRLNNYKVNPNQELIAIGVSNIIGSCFGSYAATGSFSRTALKSKCGVRTPAAGIATGIVVLLALYGLTKAFYWIPLAGLSAVIIHAVADLVASPASVYNFWRVSPLEWAIWVAAVLVTVFSSIENGIYISTGASVVLLLGRIAHPRRNILGRAVIHAEGPSTSTAPKEGREIFLPLSSALVNPSVTVTPPLPGVIVFRLEVAYLYPNASATDLFIVDYVKEHMRRGVDLSLGAVGDADWAWNDPGPAKDQDLAAVNDSRPDLKAIVMDFSAIARIDTTGVQSLIDARSQVERWADHPVEFHFASIMSPWIRRALIAGGFGFSTTRRDVRVDVVSVVPYRGATSTHSSSPLMDVEAVSYKGEEGGEEWGTVAVLDRRTPFFHVDLVAAVRAAES